MNLIERRSDYPGDALDSDPGHVLMTLLIGVSNFLELARASTPLVPTLTLVKIQ